MSFARQSLGTLVALLFGIAASIVLTRALGVTARGEYTLAVKVAGLVLAVGQWGMQEVLLEYVGERRYPTGVLMGTTFWLGIFAVAAASIAVAVAEPWLATNVLRGVDPLLVWLALAGTVASILGLMARRFIQLGGRLGVYNLLDVARNALFLALALVLIVALPRQAIGAVGAWFVGEVVLAVAALIFVWRRLQAGWFFDAGAARSFLVAGLPIQSALVASYLGNEAGSFVLNVSIGLDAVGMYAVALSVARLVLQISTSIRTVLQARLAGPSAESAMTALVTRHGLLLMLVVSLGIGVVSPRLVPLVFGPDFAPAAPALIWMLPGMVAYGVNQMLSGHLLRLGRRGIVALSSWAFVVGSIALQWVGGAVDGLVGAAIGLSLAYLLGTLIVLIAFSRLTGESPRHLLPGSGEIGYYGTLARRALASRRGPPAARVVS